MEINSLSCMCELIGCKTALPDAKDSRLGDIVIVDGVTYVCNIFGEWDVIASINDYGYYTDSVKMRPTNCKNCGAVLKGSVCEFCGTRY